VESRLIVFCGRNAVVFSDFYRPHLPLPSRLIVFYGWAGWMSGFFGKNPDFRAQYACG